jgi:hypothetical protein
MKQMGTLKHVEITKFCINKQTCSRAQVFLGNLLVISVQEISNLYGTCRFITTFTKACHWNLFWVNPIQSTIIQLISLKYISILSSHLCLSLQFFFFYIPRLLIHVTSSPLFLTLTFINCASLHTYHSAGCASQQHTTKPLNPIFEVWLAAP